MLFPARNRRKSTFHDEGSSMEAAVLEIPSAGEPPAGEINEQLARILANHRFVSADRNSRFLRYLVEKSLAGKSCEIKETIIAAEFYGRPGDYDPKVDSIVRVEASRLRTRLQSYYEHEGVNDPVRILIPRGTYVPRFERAANLEVPKENRRPWRGIALVTLTAMVGLGLARLSGVLPAAGLLLPDTRSAQASVNASRNEAVIAWQEGNELLRQDPHSGRSERGAPPTLLRALSRYEYAVAKDPSFARGWAALAEAYDYTTAFVGRNWAEDAQRAETAARRAIKLDPNLAMGHSMLAVIEFYLKWDFAAAERSYRRALELDPRNQWAVVEYADLLRVQRRFDDAASLIRQARGLLPAVPVLAVKEAEIQLDQNRPDAALLTANEAVRLNQDYRRTHLALGMAWEAKGNYDQALASYRTALAMNQEDRHVLPAIGYLLARSGRRSEAAGILRRLEDLNGRVRNCSYQLAIVHAGLAKTDEALNWLERAFRTRQAYVPHMLVDRRLDSLRSHPRFKAITEKLGQSPSPGARLTLRSEPRAALYPLPAADVRKRLGDGHRVERLSSNSMPNPGGPSGTPTEPGLWSTGWPSRRLPSGPW
jgi:tetratricopeptide (TPR) repeat protein